MVREYTATIMATYNTDNLDLLATQLRGTPKVVSKAAALTLNKTATFSTRESISEITKQVNLQPSYINKHINTTARAKHDNLRVIVSANARGTLLTRYPHHKTKDGVRVSVNATGGYREIKNAKILTSLKGSGRSGIALRNKHAVDFFKLSVRQGERTAAKSRKYQKILSKARRRPYGWTVLHSRSVNQLFNSVRADIQPQVKVFMNKTFLTDFNRLNK